MEIAVHSAISTLKLELTTPILDDRPVYVSGNFCNWSPDLDELKMERIAPGQYQFTFPKDLDLPGEIEYKYTRGGWNQVELDSNGHAPLNRSVPFDRKRVKDYVPHWRRDGVSLDSELLPIVEVFAESYDIPELRANRKIQVLLPHNYHEQPDRRYPVLYLTDAQNLFGVGSAYGNWGIDRKLAVLATRDRADIIIVAIDHGDNERINEFSPYDTPRNGKGKGREFLRFITNSLKSAIDARYRTKPHRLHTGIGGSSLGGLLATYAGLMHPDVFGKLMIFSPSLWISPRIHYDAIHFFEPFESRIYLYGGNREGANMVKNLKTLNETIEKQCYGYDRVKVKLEIDPQGKHNEARWGEEFPKALEWLYY